MDDICEVKDLGKPLYFKFTVDKFNSHFSEPQDVKDGDKYSTEEANEKFKGMCTTFPIFIDNSTLGNYEVVCENGTEIY